MPYPPTEEPSVIQAFLSETYDEITRWLSYNGLILLAVLLALFGLFVLHQFFIWLSTDPVRAFHIAKVLASGVSSVWNTLRVIYNAANDIVTALIPAVNLLAIHIVQPVIFTSLDVISLVFTGRQYGGIIKDPTTFQGHVCDGTPGSAEWCAIQA